MARSFTITQSGQNRTFSVATGVGPTGATGAAGANGADGADGEDASVTNANVNTAIATDPAASRKELQAWGCIDVTHSDYGATGDGTTDDTAAFDLAVTAADTAGLPLFIPATSNYFVISKVSIPVDMTVFGVGAQSRIKLKPGNYGDTSDTGLEGGSLSVGAFNLQSVDNVTIRDLWIDGNSSNVSGTVAANIEGINVGFSTNIRIESVTIIDAHSDGIDWDVCSDCVAHNCRLINCGGSGIHVSHGCKRVTSSTCYASGCGGTTRAGFDTSETSFGSGSPEDCMVTDCIAYDCYRGFMIGGKNNTFVTCIAIDSDHNGFRADGTEGGSDNQIQNCRATNSGSTGFSISAPRTMLNGCHAVDGTAFDGFSIAADYCNITGCSAINSFRHGIQLSSKAQNLVTGFIARDCGDKGIYILSGATNTMVSSCISNGNTGDNFDDDGTTTTTSGNYAP